MSIEKDNKDDKKVGGGALDMLALSDTFLDLWQDNLSLWALEKSEFTYDILDEMPQHQENTDGE